MVEKDDDLAEVSIFAALLMKITLSDLTYSLPPSL
jgi:hypothetical protein